MYIHVKRILGLLLSLLALVVLSPLLLILSAIIRLTSPGPVFFRQRRVGIGKTHFMIYKFRTMRIDAPKDQPTHLLKDPSAYITPVGRFLRRSSLDELPQLLNIIKGEMAVVGPRPALWNQFDLIAERDKYGANDVRPGLTGWAQINGFRGDTPIKERVEHDLWYIENWSLWLDIQILLRTAFGGFVNEEQRTDKTGEKEKTAV